MGMEPHNAERCAQQQRSIYYQAFPCIRVVQPGEFSIGPHADISYGHHPATTNFYIPLTPLQGTASLFLESRRGAEDWHPLGGNQYGTAAQFPGATCLHWTPENTTTGTRVSLDLRIVTGHQVRQVPLDARYEQGFFSVLRWATETTADGEWIREVEGDQNGIVPDGRMGVPWTVTDWDQYHARRKNKHNNKIEQEFQGFLWELHSFLLIQKTKKNTKWQRCVYIEVQTPDSHW
jgi:hypothetical protein